MRKKNTPSDRDALGDLESVLSKDSRDLPALKAIATIYEADRNWGQLTETIERIIETFQMEADELKAYYAKLGTIYSDNMQRPRQAIEAWRYASLVDPSDLEPLRALEKLYTDEGMWDELVEVLGRRAELHAGDEMVDIFLRQARVYEDRLDAPLRAKASYARILTLAPLHPLAFERSVAIESKKSNWGEVTELHLNRLGVVVEKDERVLLYHALAKIYEEHLRELDKAFIVMQTAFEEDHSNDITVSHLERLASTAGKWDDLLASANRVLQAEEDHRTRNELCLRIGKWYADELCCPEYAIGYYQQVLQLNPYHLVALEFIGELYRGTKQWNELAAVLERAAKREPDAERQKLLYLELGQLYEDHLQNAPLARDAYKAALNLDPSLKEAILALERMLNAEGNWRELLPVLRNKLDLFEEDPDSRAAIHLRMGEVFEEHLADPQSAIDEYRRVLEVEPGHLPALKGLERLFGKRERWQDLLEVLGLELEYARSERERIHLLERIAQMQEEEFVRPDQAAEKYERILKIDPSHENAHIALERLYRHLAMWRELMATLERHLNILSDRTAKIECYVQMGEVYATQLQEGDRALGVYKKILDLDRHHAVALDQLASLQTRKGDWAGAEKALARLAKTATTPQQKIDLLYRLGKLNEDNLKKRDVAAEYYRSALDIEPGYSPALAALKQIYLDEGQWIPACRVLEAQQQHAPNPRQRSKLQLALGELCADKLHDDARAAKWYEEALRSDADNQEAIDILVDLYIKAEQWREAEALLDRLILSGEKTAAAQMQSVYRKTAQVAEKLGNLKKALKAYRAAFALNKSHLETAFRLADIHSRLAQWNEAHTLFKWLLSHLPDEPKEQALVEIYYRLGIIEAKLDNARKAQKMFDKVLKIDAGNRHALTAIADLYAEQKNWKKVIHYKQVLTDAVNGQEKSRLLVEIGDVWKQQLEQPKKAISFYVEATEHSPTDRAILHKLLPVYQQIKQWQKVIDVIGRLISLETDNENFARLYYSMGVVFRDEIHSAEDAVEKFNLSLDYSAENLKAFEAIDRILTERKDWKSLERSYRKMLFRLSGKGRTDLEIQLWHNLGEIYRTRMGQSEPAAEAFKMASALDPDNKSRHEVLVELYASMPDSADKAVAEYQGLIQRSPRHVEYYKKLCRLYWDNRQYDKAWCLCAALVYFDKAGDKERQFFEKHKKRGQARTQARLKNEHWFQYLFHQEESVYVGKVFEAVTRAIRNLRVQPLRAFDLKKGHNRRPSDKDVLSKSFFYAAQVLNLPVIPELYLQKNSPGGLSFVITDPMATACGSTLLSGYSPQDILFLTAKHLTYYRPEHYIRWLLPTQGDLKLLLLAAMKIGAPGIKLPKDKSGALDRYVGALQQQLQPLEAEMVGKVIRRFVKSGEIMDVKKWVRAVEITSCRAGLLLVSDLAVAARMVQDEAGAGKDVPAQEKIKELLLFSVSEEYFRLRAALGISVGT